MANIARLGITEEFVVARDIRRQRISTGMLGSSAVAAAGVFGIVLLIIATIVYKGAPAITWDFLSSAPSDGMTRGGIWPMLRGSILLMFGTLLLTLPIGIFGGIWLAEYAGDGRFSGALRACITALAGTPSIIFGLFGLAIFVLKMGLGTSLIAGWLTLALFSIPIVVLTTETAIRTVPESFEEAALSLGLSKWQTIRKVMLPTALPGIMTGLVFAASRAAGEAPPILLTAGIYYSTEKLALGLETLQRPVANLPYHLAEGYRQGGVIPEKIIWGTCLTLMLFVLTINLSALLIRARARAKQGW